jgi:predicted nucleotidyltransferase
MNDATLSAQPPSAIDRLRGKNPGRWPHITAAKVMTRESMAVLAKLAADLLPTDEGALLVFGSLGRAEFNDASDLDWAVLIDGRADSDHIEIVHQLKPKLEKAGFEIPGPTGLFGGLVFSHELIHAIGGDEDTNKNMTRRLLLLLESAPVAVAGSEPVRDRIIQGVLHRYIVADATGRAKEVPRFLLNDVVRFWRTMAVDYASKFRARGGEGWAERNIKLRMSRKLLFISGLFMCFSWTLSRPKPGDEDLLAERLVAHLQDWTQRPPLESLAVVVEQYAPALAADVFDSYDSFLQMLGDEKKRATLEALAPEDAYRNRVFCEARDFSKTFNDALIKLLFEANNEVSELTKRYAVF